MIISNYITHEDVEQSENLTASVAKQYTADQATAIEKIITAIHGEIIEIIGEELTSTEGLRSIELRAVQRHIWNQKNPDKEPKDVFTERMIATLKSARSRVTDTDNVIYAKETH